MIRCYQLTIQGRVQGVGFRYWLKNQADECGIYGIAKNLADGSVYAEIESEETKALDFIEKCRQGPPLAHVSRIAVLESAVKDYSDFSIKR
ncbi:MAG: acylphosphatase [Bacteroidales bacterium]